MGSGLTIKGNGLNLTVSGSKLTGIVMTSTGKCADTDLCQRTVSATQKTRAFSITKAVGRAACCGPQHRICRPCGRAGRPNAEMLGTGTADMAGTNTNWIQSVHLETLRFYEQTNLPLFKTHIINRSQSNGLPLSPLPQDQTTSCIKYSEFRSDSRVLFNIIRHPMKDFIYRVPGQPYTYMCVGFVMNVFVRVL
jgi:hypothetical protein